MIAPFSKLSINHKIVLIIMLVCITAMFLTGGAFIIYEWLSIRQRMVNDLSVHAEMLADNSIGALSFDDPEDAREVLGSLSNKRTVISAVVHREDGTVFATYRREGVNHGTPPLELLDNGHLFDRDRLFIFKPIIFNNSVTSTL